MKVVQNTDKKSICPCCDKLCLLIIIILKRQFICSCIVASQKKVIYTDNPL